MMPPTPHPQAQARLAHPEGGNILITVMAVMVATMLLVTALVEHYVVTESREVQDSLVRVQAFWAMSGVVDYTLSRARRAAGNGEALDVEPPNPTKAFAEFSGDDNLQSAMGLLFNELNSGNAYAYGYPEYSANYTLSVTTTASEDDNANTADGAIRLVADLSATGDVPSLRSVVDQTSGLTTPGLRVEFCMEYGATLDCGSDGNNPGQHRITLFRRDL